ncbi:MAG: Bug family tripartite tricarboxylate transporter substrate binding protein [Gemmatimonas sp.]
MLSLSKVARAAGVALAACALVATAAQADEVADFYKGKTFNFVVGYPPSGGYDAYTRLLARYLGKHIPGNPTVIVQNMPGASSFKSVQYMAAVAPKDGSTIGMFNRGLMPQAKMKPQEVNVDFSKLTWIGSMNSDIAVCTIWAAKGIKTIADARKSQIVVGDTSKNSGGYIYASILHSLAPDNTRTILGYGTSGDVWLAMEKGEVDANCNVWSSMKSQRPQWFTEHKANILVQFSRTPHPDLKDVPLVFDVATTDDQKKALDFLMASEAIARPIVGPPGMHAARAAALQKAFADTMKDPELIATAEKTQMELNPVYADEAAKIARDINSAPADAIALAKKMIDIE